MIREAATKLQFLLKGFSDKNEITSTLAVGIVVCIAVYWLISRKRYNLPPGPRGVPLLGYLPFLGKEPYKHFDRLSKQYGSIYGLYLGRMYVVLLNDFNVIKEALSQSVTLGRPTTQFEFLPDGAGLSSANGSEWTEQRRYAVRSMRNIGLGGSKWETMVQDELDDILKLIEKQGGDPLNYIKVFSESISNNITMLIFGKRFPVGDRARQLVDKSIEMGIDNIDISFVSFFPAIAKFLAKFGLGGQNKDLHKIFAELTNFLKKETEKRKKIFMSEETEIFVDGYLKEMQNNTSNSLNNSFHEGNLRGNIVSLLSGGSDTTTSSIIWLLIAMIEYPDIQEKVYRELITVLGKDGRATYSERMKLPYTYAVMMECGRWSTIVPLTPARLAMEDTKIGGYDIPKGTMIISNLWSVHNSSKYWKQPEKFIPERFLTEDGQFLTEKLDGYLPFSHGKRNCPGETVGKITIFQYFAGIMQKFKVLPPVGQKPKLEAKPGITYRPVAQELRLVLRK